MSEGLLQFPLNIQLTSDGEEVVFDARGVVVTASLLNKTRERLSSHFVQIDWARKKLLHGEDRDKE